MSAQDGKAVTIVTQTRVEPGKGEDFARWQQRVSEAVATQPGFVKETVMPPSPPSQVDWVILQRFASRGAAVTWLRSAERQRLVAEAQPILVGQDDIHLVSNSQPGVLPAPVSAVISTRIKPGQEEAYLQWGRRIAEAQAKSPGFQGYRREPPVPGVQEDWLTILRFDSEANLQTWLNSPERKKLLEESEAFTDECHTRIVRTGFDQWFEVPGAAPPSAWKQNMVVLMVLYPLVFLLNEWLQKPILVGIFHLPYWLLSVHQQRGQRRPAQPDPAPGEPAVELVAQPRRARRQARPCRRGAGDRDLCPLADRLLAISNAAGSSFLRLVTAAKEGGPRLGAALRRG